MKRVFLLLSLLACAMMLVSCSNFSRKTVKVKDGIYLVKESEIGPYVVFNTDESYWRSGGGLALSYAVGGKYRIDGRKIIAESDDGLIEIVFEAKNETELIVRSVRCDVKGISFWVKIGDVYQLTIYGSASSSDRV